LIHHAAYGLPPEALDVIIIEDSKPMLLLLRSIVASLQPSRIRVFESAEDAVTAMLAEPPNLIITDWRMKPISGFQLLRTMRSRRMAPLCFVPVIMVTAYGTRALVDKAIEAGAQQVLVKPLSPAMLVERIRYMLKDARRFVLGQGDSYVVEGVAEQLAAQHGRSAILRQARAFVAGKAARPAGVEPAAEAGKAPAFPPAKKPVGQRRPRFAAVSR
jgi:two-component system chemotaxis response regulator CheY